MRTRTRKNKHIPGTLCPFCGYDHSVSINDIFRLLGNADQAMTDQRIKQLGNGHRPVINSYSEKSL